MSLFIRDTAKLDKVRRCRACHGQYTLCNGYQARSAYCRDCILAQGPIPPRCSNPLHPEHHETNEQRQTLIESLRVTA